MSRKNTVFRSTRIMTLAAMLTAISVVIGIMCKNFLNFGNGLFRITFENLPIILSGVLFGPIVGGLSGVASDLVSYLLSAQSYPPNLIVSLGAFLIGFLSGLTSKFISKTQRKKQVIAATAFSHLFGSMIVKSYGLFRFYGWAILVRVPLYLIIGTVEALLLLLLFRSKIFSGILAKYDL